MLTLLSDGSLFSEQGFMPHGHCYLWTPSLVWTMLITDTVIGFAYLSISICLYVLVRRIRLPFSAMFLAFGLFIGACGATHFMEVYTLWYPHYWLAAFIKVITAIASFATATIMFPLFPRVLDFAENARLSGERKRQLEILNAELIAKTEALMTANRELEAFSYSVSHDLRTPLRGVDGFSRALQEDYGNKLDAQGLEYLGYIRSGAQRMSKIIEDLLDLSRVTRTELREDEFDLSAIVIETNSALQRANSGRAVELKIESGIKAKGDVNLIRLVVENLLSNAWKFTSKIESAVIEFGLDSSSSTPGEQVYFIRDNGVGFEMAKAAKLFSAFQRLHSTDEYVGTGVGLATAKRIIERHGGTIWVTSAPQQGTTFYFTIGGTK